MIIAFINMHVQVWHMQQVFMITFIMTIIIGHALHGNLQLIYNLPNNNNDNNQDDNSTNVNPNTIDDNDKKTQ